MNYPTLLIPFVITLVPVTAPTMRHTSTVAIVLDVSGSMDGELDRAWHAWAKVSEQPTDDMRLAVIAFNDETYVYPKWLRLPDAEKLGKATSWVKSHIAQGDTLVIPALKKALALRKKNLTVVLVSDGQFHSEDADEIAKAIATMQKWREKRGYGKAVISCVATVPIPPKGLRQIQNGGGLFATKRTAKPAKRFR